jgi:hypothetical protein
VIRVGIGRGAFKARGGGNQPPPPPPPPPGDAVLIAGTDFNNGLIAPFTQWGGYTAQPVTVVDDFTGSGRGKIAKVAYERLASSPGGRDVNGGLYIPQSNPVIGTTFGQTVYLEHDFWLPNYPNGVPQQPAQDQRKLWYTKGGGDDPNDGEPTTVRTAGFYPVLWGRPDASGMDMWWINEDNVTYGDPFIVYGVASFAWETWYKIGVEYKLNQIGVADGRVRIWINDQLKMDLPNFEWFKGGVVGAAAYIYEWGIGNQEQWNIGEPVDMKDFRCFDRIAFYDKAPTYLNAA